MNHKPLVRAEQLVGDNKRADGIIAGPTTSIPDHVRIALCQTSKLGWVKPRIHAGQDGKAARGMEFSSQPFDISHQETVAMSPLFGTPTFRWLPAKSTLETRFLMFYTKAPAGFTRIDDVLSFEERQAIVRSYAATAGFAREQVNKAA